MKSFFTKLPHAGFTLVELAIVMTIIGLLIGGILKGQVLLQNARVSSTISQIEGYKAALVTFQDKYEMLPGDTPNAMARLPGCSAATFCSNGDGDGIIGPLNTAIWTNIDTTITSENTQYWKHLALAGLIGGINPAASSAGFGSSQPTSKVARGGYFATSVNASPMPSSFSIKVMTNISGLHEYSSISPMIAARLDTKMDDGIALSGMVQSVSASWQDGCGDPLSGTQGRDGYDRQREQQTCQQLYRMF